MIAITLDEEKQKTERVNIVFFFRKCSRQFSMLLNNKLTVSRSCPTTINRAKTRDMARTPNGVIIVFLTPPLLSRFEDEYFFFI